MDNGLHDQHDKQDQRPQQEAESSPIVSVTSGGRIVDAIERIDTTAVAAGDVDDQSIEQ